MDYKFKLGKLNVDIPQTEVFPEIKVNLEDVEVEVKDACVEDIANIFTQIRLLAKEFREMEKEENFSEMLDVK